MGKLKYIGCIYRRLNPKKPIKISISGYFLKNTEEKLFILFMILSQNTIVSLADEAVFNLIKFYRLMGQFLII
jgi:hypothetical protein